MKIKYLIIMGIFLVLFGTNIISAEPTVNEITTTPTKPKPESTVKVVVNISGENISNVALTASECSDETGLCYENPIQNKNMTLSSDGNYETEFTLLDSDDRTDHIEYRFIVTDDGKQYILQDDSYKTNLDLSSNNKNNAGDKGSNSNDTPGFEMAFVFIALIIGMLYFTKKR